MLSTQAFRFVKATEFGRLRYHEVCPELKAAVAASNVANGSVTQG